MRQAGLVWIAVTGIACADPPAAPLAAGASGGSVSAPDGGIERSGDASTGELQPIERGEAPHAAESAHPQVLRLVTWNIQAGRASSLEAVAQRLATLEPDIVTLQEVDVDTRRTGRVHQPALLAQQLGFHYAFAQTIPWSGGKYGIATLSRYPFAGLRRIPLSNQDAGEPRTALVARVCAAERCTLVINHHADVRPLAAARSTLEIVADLAPELGQGVALLADLNQVPQDVGPVACSHAGLTDVGASLDDVATQGGRRIDYAYVDSALAPCIEAFRVQPGTESDHAALVLDLERSCLPH